MDRRIEEIYAKRRTQAEDEQRARLEALSSKLPDFKRIDVALSQGYTKLAKAKIRGDENGEKLIKVELESLKCEKTTLLKLNGIDENFLKPHYFCENCQDTGYAVAWQRKVKCNCLRLEEAKILYKNSNMLSRLEIENFQNFNMLIFDAEKDESQDFSQKENMEDIVSNVKAYISNFDNIKGKGLIFFGGVGLGKSYLCSCIGKELIDAGKTVLYYSMYDFVKLTSKFTFEKNSYFAEYPSDDYRQLDKVDLLIIDDLGAELTNNFVISELFNIVNSRIIKNRSTVMSTNLNVSEMESRYGERLFSRFLMYFSFFKFIGIDVRMKL